MRSLLLIISVIAIALNVRAQKTEAVSHKYSKPIYTGELKKWGYSNTNQSARTDKEKQPISGIMDVERFVDNFFRSYSNDISDSKIQGWLDDYIKDRNNATKNRVIIFIQHPVELSKLYGDTTEANNLEKKFREACRKVDFYEGNITKLNSIKNSIESCVLSPTSCMSCESLTTTSSGNDCIEKAIKVSKDAFLLEKIKGLNDIGNLIKTETELKLLYASQRDTLEKQFNSFLPQFVEKDVIEAWILNKEGKEWSNYNLNKKEILFIVLGGLDDFSKWKIKIKNKQGYFQSSVNGIMDIITGSGLLPKQNDASDCTPRNTLRRETIPLSFFLVDQDLIKAPSDITFNDTKDSVRVSMAIHEKTYWGIKAGISAAHLNVKQFTLNSANELTVKLDSIDSKAWKSNLVALIEFYPFGRDIDRLEPIWAKGQKTNILDRVGIVAGLRISADPIQDIYFGGSFALSRDFSLGAGMQFHSEPRNLQNLPVGVNASLDYLKSNVAREYKSQFFFSFLMDPNIVAKWLGFKK